MKHTASDVAKWLLQYNDIQQQQEGADSISNLKLQKLLYYAQGAFLGLKSTPLFDDRIEAWEHGPVVPSVYQEYKCNHGSGILNFTPPQETYTPEEVSILRTVYEQFACYSAWGLRNMTHHESPWKDTPRNAEIKPQIIESYFKEHYISNG